MVYQRINFEERVLISIRLNENWDYQSNSNDLNRSKGTISREVNRGCIIDIGEHVYDCRCPTKGKRAGANKP
jgi:IS30 family transposase